MSVAFAFEVTRSRRVAQLFALSAAIPAAGLALAAAQFAAGPTLLLEGAPTVRAALALASLLGAFVLAWQALRALRAGPGPCGPVFLSVDEDGAPSLVAAPGASTVPVALRASCGLPGLILLVLSPSAPQSASRMRTSAVTVLSGRDGLSDDDWRRLNVWLRWMERGRHTLPSS